MKDTLIQIFNRKFRLGVVFIDKVEGAKTTLYRFNLVDPLNISYVKTPKFQLQLSHVLKQQVNIYIGQEYDFGVLIFDKPNGVLYSTDLKEGGGYAFPIGRTIDGNDIFLAFGKQINHVLIAGASGSGKSVLLNTLINKALEQNGPNNLKFLFIDTKRVELSKYDAKYTGGMNITAVSADTALFLLQEASIEMDKRYKQLEENPSLKLAPFFIVIDELADLMLSKCRDEMEAVLGRLAQMGRGACIYLIVATQNPLARVCTPLLKANTTTKICLKCSNYHQSIVILDHRGGEDLFGKGDAIIKLPFLFEELRVQIAYTPQEKIEENIKKWYDLDEGFWGNFGPLHKYEYKFLHGKMTGEKKLNPRYDPMYFDRQGILARAKRRK